jgi:hypothetical protein
MSRMKFKLSDVRPICPYCMRDHSRLCCPRVTAVIYDKKGRVRRVELCEEPLDTAGVTAVGPPINTLHVTGGYTS